MESIIILGVICILQFIYIAYTEHEHQVERKDLYNRLMAKDLTEYSNVGAQAPKIRSSNPMVKNSLENSSELGPYMK